MTEFRIGLALEPSEFDARRTDEYAAIALAGELSHKSGWRTAVAVWDDRGDPVHLFLMGEHFKRA